jgi:hypothetical protein
MQRAPQDNQLMPKHRVLSLKPQLRLEMRGHDGQNETEQPNHSGSSADSIASSIRIRFSVQTACLHEARFNRAHLQGALLKKAQLQGADFTNAHLTAVLSGAYGGYRA